MAPEQANAVLYEEAFNPGEFALPDPAKADALIAEFEADIAQADELITVVDTLEQIHGVLDNAPDKVLRPLLTIRGRCHLVLNGQV